ncbi:MAG: dihydroneopterin aldolase [Fidelibacterota bacterium]|nr:MAG: dihydroneopterin aldolase [Candidatus Neomarinimicrobiota bacterium]
MDTIRLNNIVLYARHGVAPEERELGQRFFLDVEIHADLSAAAQTDKLSQAINYEAVYHTVATTFTGSTCQLLEGIAWRVMQALFQEYPVERVTIRVRKPSVRIEGVLDSVEVELSRNREEMGDG